MQVRDLSRPEWLKRLNIEIIDYYENDSKGWEKWYYENTSSKEIWKYTGAKDARSLCMLKSYESAESV